jgi:hypothetical protein
MVVLMCERCDDSFTPEPDVALAGISWRAFFKRLEIEIRTAR